MKKRFLLLGMLIMSLVCAFGLSACGSHEYKDVVTAPTCTTKGYTTHICDCGHQYIDTFTEKLEHKFTNYVQVSELDETAQCDYGCGATDTRDVDTILFTTLDVTGSVANGKVSNAVEEFDFADEIHRNGNADFFVSLDPYGVYICSTKVAPLSAGDNEFYIFETIGGEIFDNYTVTIRRLEMYTVTFNANGGSAVDTQIVEEDSLLSPVTSVRAGYLFDNWGYDFNNPVKQSMTLTANWNAMFELNGGVITGVTNAGKTLTEIVIPSVIDGVTITEIADYAIEYCLNLTSVVIPDTVTKIGIKAFDRCYALESVVLPDTISYIGNGAFSQCTSLESITIPDGINTIGFYMFTGCSSLKEIYIPSSVESFGYDVFKDCTSLESIYFDGTVAEWNDIHKALGWKDGASALAIVYCTDGETNI